MRVYDVINNYSWTFKNVCAMKVIIFGFVLHIIFLLSVFDIYFKSPLLNNVTAQHNHIYPPPAKRLLLFVADGLRADSIFSVVNNNVHHSPFIRSVIEQRGVWGVAHCRVPTESRPGHIALIAGLYEDPSAVFTGWKDNLVEFDSVFNRSFATYSWGSPDILPMFKKGAVENKVYTDSYSEDSEDFSGHSSTRLNTWVFDRVEQFLRSAKNDNNLSHSLHSQGVVFFLHLLGTDVSGHANKPFSRQYKENIKVIDDGVKKIESLINEFYEQDNQTAFIYTSDHGMTDWGSHGAGSPSETEVPLVAWGAGLTSPQVLPSPHPLTPAHWGLSHLRRVDVAQADVAPLMAVLIGASIPVHSVGVLPLDYLSVSGANRASALLLNADQLIAQLSRKRDSVEANLLPTLYSPFSELSQQTEQALRLNVTRLIQQEKYDEAIEEIKILIKLSQSGLEYYHSYFQNLLLACVSFSFIGWVSWLICLLQGTNSDVENKFGNFQDFLFKKIQLWPDVVFLMLSFAAVVLIFVQSLPAQFYIYCCLPLLLWWAVARQCKHVVPILSNSHLAYVICSVVIYLVLLELLVLTFFRRWVLSLVVSAVSIWPFTLRERKTLVPLSAQLCWVLASLALAAFPCLPVIGQQTQIHYVIVCGCLWLVLGVTSLFWLGLRKADWVVPLQLLLLSAAIAVIWSTSNDFESEKGLRSVNQVAAWTLLVVSLPAPLAASSRVPQRFLSLGLALAVPFLLLCVGHEAFFFFALFLSLCVWLYIEACLAQTELSKINFKDTPESNYGISADHFQKCFFFLMYVIMSFFGTGNIASVNSFDVSWVRCFLTVFSPFTMMALILLKTLVPFLLVTCAFRAINIFSQVTAEKMFIIVLIYCDIMGLHFLFAVTNKGSWLEIGTSVSHFVIMEVTVLFLAALYFIARLYTGSVLAKELNTSHSITPIWMPLHKKHPD